MADAGRGPARPPPASTSGWTPSGRVQISDHAPPKGTPGVKVYRSDEDPN